MNPPKQYVPKASVKRVDFTSGGHMLKLNFHAETLINFIKANANAKGYITFDCAERREVGQYGDTHSLCLDTWQPKPQGDGRSQPRASAPKADAPGEQVPPPVDDDGSSVPF